MTASFRLAIATDGFRGGLTGGGGTGGDRLIDGLSVDVEMNMPEVEIDMSPIAVEIETVEIEVEVDMSPIEVEVENG